MLKIPNSTCLMTAKAEAFSFCSFFSEVSVFCFASVNLSIRYQSKTFSFLLITRNHVWENLHKATKANLRNALRRQAGVKLVKMSSLHVYDCESFYRVLLSQQLYFQPWKDAMQKIINTSFWSFKSSFVKQMMLDWEHTWVITLKGCCSNVLTLL